MRTPMYHHSSASDTHDMYALTGLHPGRHRHAARRLTLHQRARTVHVGPRPHSAAPPLRTACWTFVSQAAYVCRTRIRQPEAGTPALAARTASQTTAIASVVSNANVVLESQIVSWCIQKKTYVSTIHQCVFGKFPVYADVSLSMLRRQVLHGMGARGSGHFVRSWEDVRPARQYARAPRVGSCLRNGHPQSLDSMPELQWQRFFLCGNLVGKRRKR